MSEKRVGSAKFSSMRNDLFWKYLSYENGVWVKLKWFGYNDAYWWNEIATDKGAATKKAADGKTYRIDFRTCDVYEVVE